MLGGQLALAKTGPHFEEGLKQLERMEYDEALASFERALSWPGNTGQDRARIQLQIGIAQSNLGKYDAAEQSFKRALAEDPEVALPSLTSPKIRALFERVRAEARAQTPASPPTPAEPPPPEPATEDAPEVEDKPSRVNWPAWITLGVAVAAGGTGLAMGLLYRSEKEQAEDLSTRYDAAVEHADRANSRGLAAAILFGAAGAAAVTSAVLFYLGWKKKDDTGATTSAMVVPTRSGALLQLEVRR